MSRFVEERKIFKGGRWIPYKDATPQEIADDLIDKAEYDLAMEPAGGDPEPLRGMRY